MNIESVKPAAPVWFTGVSPVRQLVDEHGWFTVDAHGIVRCPLLVKGELVGPPPVAITAIERAFAELDRDRTSADPYATYAIADGAQVLRHC